MLRLLLAALALCLAAGAAADDPADTVPQQAAPKPAAKPAVKPAAKKAARAPVRPTWAELSAQQQEVLAPLKDDWANLEIQRRRKWIGIAKRYPTMKPEEQARVQRRMQAWAKLTPEQRRQARENYKNIAKDKDRHGNLRDQWADYQALPPEERQSLVPPPADQKRR